MSNTAHQVHVPPPVSRFVGRARHRASTVGSIYAARRPQSQYDCFEECAIKLLGIPNNLIKLIKLIGIPYDLIKFIK